MPEPYLSQIEAFAFGLVPHGWAQCAGQIVPINQNQALFSLIGTTYGGDGVTNFALPDLRGRSALGVGQGSGLSPYALGQKGGEETHVLTIAETPPHNHAVVALGAPLTGPTNVPGPGVKLSTGASTQNPPIAEAFYGPATAAGALAAAAIGTTGGAGHENRMPYLALNYCIALQGVYPSRN